MKDKTLYELLSANKENLINFGGQVDVNAIVKLLADNYYCKMPCKVGDTVYKLCPMDKVNKVSECYLSGGSCKNCDSDGCVYGFINKASQLSVIPPLISVPLRVTNDNIFIVMKYWNILYFKTEEDAKSGIDSYYSALEGKTAEERFTNYCKWCDSRKLKMSEVAELTTPDDDFAELISKGYDEVEYYLENTEDIDMVTELLLKKDSFRVYKHISSNRYFCMDKRKSNVLGRVCEVELLYAVSYCEPEELKSEELDKLIELSMTPCFCSGKNYDGDAYNLYWFKKCEQNVSEIIQSGDMKL